MTTALMTIRQMCDAYSVTPRTLRFYEAKELLFPRRQGTRRLFTPRDQARLTLILRGKRYGFSLEDIRQLLDMYDQDGNDLRQAREARVLAAERLHAMEAEQADLEARITELRQAIADDGKCFERNAEAG